MTVRIYLMVSGVEVWRWLCTRCLRSLEARGWAQKENKDPPHPLGCDGDECQATRVKAGESAGVLPVARKVAA